MVFDLSFEFFPPRSPQGLSNLKSTAQTFISQSPLRPEYFSITFGAGGSSATQDKTLTTCIALQSAITSPLCPHVSCVGTSKSHLRTLLDQYQAMGIRALLVLRGDLPLGENSFGDFQYACDLVSWIKKKYADIFHITVACYPEIHPQASNAKADFEHFQRKVDAGADAAITQYFFNLASYEHFCSLCAKANITIPIIPGIMPITQYEQLSRFSATCGAEIPRWLRKQLETISTDPVAIAQFGTDVLVELCTNLKNSGAPGLHFYTLNKPAPTLAICQRLGLEQKKVPQATMKTKMKVK